MPYERLEDSRVHQEAEEISDAIWDEVEKWKPYYKNVMGRQLAEAADSIGANIAESYGRTGTKDVILFLIYARGSMYETKNCIGKAVRRKLIDAKQGDVILNRLECLAPMLNAYITAKRKFLRQRPTT